jgi:hypothetical protein
VERAAFFALLPPSSLKRSRKSGYISFIKPRRALADSEPVIAVEARPGKNTFTVTPSSSSRLANAIDMASITLFECWSVIRPRKPFSA